jgi:flagellar biosynthesis protein FliQ
MDTVFGLLGVVVFIAGVIAIASAVTWVVVKIFPATRQAKEQAEG